MMRMFLLLSTITFVAAGAFVSNPRTAVVSTSIPPQISAAAAAAAAAASRCPPSRTGAFPSRMFVLKDPSSDKTPPVASSDEDRIGDDDEEEDEEEERAEEAEDEAATAEFKARTKALCEERNLPFERVKNARDLASVAGSPVRPGRIYRMGRVSDASESDLRLLNEIDFRTLVDLRSPTELKDDPTLQRSEVFDEYTDIVWMERGRTKDGCIRVLKDGENPVKKHFWNKKDKKRGGGKGGAASKEDSQQAKALEAIEADVEVVSKDSSRSAADAFVEAYLLDDADDEDDDDDCEECEEEGSFPASLRVQGLSQPSSSKADADPRRKERHFVSLMNEFKYVKGTLSRVRKRDITKSILKSPGAVFSKRARASAKKPFLDKINNGGLPMLNELLLRYGAPGIRYVLELIADTDRHPIGFYCTAGKDRTGMIAAIVLALCGVSKESIVEDYSLSANVYAEMNDHQAMVGALSQRSLDPKTFLGAPPQVMYDTLDAIEQNYGDVEGYCTQIGFGPDKQEQLRQAVMGE